MSRQVQRDTARGVLSVLDVAHKAHKHIHEHDGSHAAVEDPGVTAKIHRILHVVFQSDDLWKRIGKELVSTCYVDMRAVRSSSDRDQITIKFVVRSRSVHDQITISSWSDNGPFMVRSRSVRGQITVRS